MCNIDVCSTTTIFNGDYLCDNAEKVDLGDMRDNDKKRRKVCAEGNKHYPGKEWIKTHGGDARGQVK